MLKYLQKSLSERFKIYFRVKFQKFYLNSLSLESTEKIVLKDLYVSIKFDKVSVTLKIFKKFAKFTAVQLNPSTNVFENDNSPICSFLRVVSSLI